MFGVFFLQLFHEMLFCGFRFDAKFVVYTVAMMRRISSVLLRNKEIGNK